MRLAPKFTPSRLAATGGALEAIAASGQTPEFFIAKHLAGDWGQVNGEDRRLNDEAVRDGSRLLSVYRTLRGVRLYVITEAADEGGVRAATTILLPEEY